ncbi:TraB family protein [Euphorbia peplus]|nr:TraB family protein [Euphorbia peplus]
METLLKSASPIFTNKSNFRTNKRFKTSKASIKPPPSDFDFRSEILHHSTATIAISHPQLLDLANKGTLVLIENRLFGPVPPWRTDFVEPEAIWLVATSHISTQSAADVERVVRAVMPDNVVVELCRSRAGIMYTSDEGEGSQKLRSSMFSLSGTGFFGAVGRSVNLGGQTALALRFLLALFSSKLSSDANRPFGDEFRAARKMSEEVGAQIVLGDRPIEITLERAWKALSRNEKFNLVTSVVRGITSSSDTSRDNLKALSKEDGSTFELYQKLGSSYPSLLQPLIHERDTYLAWSLKRSKAVRSGKRVVGIIGKGHMNGVIYSLISDSGELRFSDLVGKKGSGEGSVNSVISNILKTLVRDTVVGVILWEFYQLIMAAL